MGFTAGDLHIDTPLTNLVIGFEPKDFIVDQIYPMVQVDKQSNKFYKWDKGEFFRIPNTHRAPMTKGNEVVFNVSSDSYFANNFSIRHKESWEAMTNADKVLKSREKRVRALKNILMLDWEDRVARQITSGSNLGSFTTLSGTAQWSDYDNSDPVSDVEVGKDAVRATTGMDANVMIMGRSVFRKLVHHPDIIERIKYVQKGLVTADIMAALFEIPKILVGKTIKNTGEEGHTDSFTDVWGKHVVIARITDGPEPDGRDPSLGYTFRWNAPLLNGQPMAAEVWNDPDGGNFENRRVMFYQDEKLTATELGYQITNAVS